MNIEDNTIEKQDVLKTKVKLVSFNSKSIDITTYYAMSW